MFTPLLTLQTVLSAVAGAVFAALVLVAYDAVFDDPAVRAETRKLVEAEAIIRTEEAINDITDKADKARAMRRFCLDAGRLYDFQANKCGDATAQP